MMILGAVLVFLAAWGLCSTVRTVRSQPPSPEGSVTSSGVIRPRSVRPGAPPWNILE